MRPIRLTRLEQQAATRERLITAAEAVFARQGFGGASIDLIAAEAGFSKGAVYSNFESKEALFLELLRRFMERDRAALAKIVAEDPARLISAVTHWLKTIHLDRDCPALAAELQLHARRSPEFAVHYYALQAEQTKALAQILEAYFRAVGRTMPLDPLDLAAAVVALAHGLSLQHPIGQPEEPSPAGRVIDALLRLLTGNQA